MAEATRVPSLVKVPSRTNPGRHGRSGTPFEKQPFIGPGRAVEPERMIEAGALDGVASRRGSAVGQHARAHEIHIRQIGEHGLVLA